MVAVVKVENFDVDVGASGTTYTLSNDVGSLSDAFIRRPGPSDKASGGPTGSTGNTNPVDVHIGVELTGTDEITWRRGSSTTSKITGEVWRYTGAPGGIDEFICRSHAAVSVGTGTTGTLAISGITDRNDCVPFITGVSTTETSVNNYEDVTFTAYIDASDNLVVERGSGGAACTVYVDVVEFTGSRWRVGHGISTSHDSSQETVILDTDSTGTGGSEFAVTSWSNAFIEATMGGDSTETGLSDVLMVALPGVDNNSVIFNAQYGDAGARNDADGHVHVIENSSLSVAREEIVSIAEGNGTYGSISFPSGAPTTNSIDELALEWFVDTSGTGTAHARGRLQPRITNATGTVQHWVHRSGNDVDVAWGVIDLSLVDNVVRPEITNVAPPFFVNPGTIGVITGANFGATQGTGDVEISDNATYGAGTVVSQTINSWSDTSIEITSVHTGLSNGVVYVFVTDDNGERSAGFRHTLGAKSYSDFIDELLPDHRWTFDNTYADTGTFASNPANNSITGTPTFETVSLCRNVSQSILVNALGEGFGPANSNQMNNGAQTRRTMHGWISLTDILTALTCIYEEGGNVNNAAWLVGFGNVLMGQIADTGDFYIQAYSDFKLAVDRPYHIVWRFGASGASNNFTCFVDGIEVSTTNGNPPDASDFDSHTGDIAFGAPDSLEVGGTDVTFASPVGCRYNEWASWRQELSALQISQNLFQAGMTAQETLTEDTPSAMQTDLDNNLANTTIGNWPCGIEIQGPTGSADLTLTADNIVFDDGITYDIQWQGSGTLAWINKGTSNASTASTFLGGGTVNFVDAVPITLTVRDIDTGLPVQNARVFLETQVDITNPGGFIEDPIGATARAPLDSTTINGFLPATPGEFTFPAPWNTTGIRLTNADTQFSSDAVFPHDYSYWRVTNNHVGSDEMKIMVRLAEAEGGPSIITYNKVTGAVSAPVPIFDVGVLYRNPTGFQNAYFSGTDPNKMYWAYEGAFRSIDISSLPLSNGDITTVFSGSDTGAGNKVWQAHSSADDRYHAMTYRTSGYSALGAVVYDEVGDTFQTFPAIGAYDECQIDKGGNWLLIKENVDSAQGEDNRIFDLSGGLAAAPATEKVLNDLEGAGGHSDLGYGWMVAADNFANNPSTQRLWNLTTPAPLDRSDSTEVFRNTSYTAPSPNHVSWSHAVPSSTTPIADQYVVGSAGSTTTSQFSNEIFAIPLDGSRNCLVIAPNMTDMGAGAGGDFYNRLPKGSTDITGEYFIWTSNKGGQSRMDLFMVKIPVQLISSGTGIGDVLFNDLTDVNGQVATDFVYDSGDTDVVGRVRRGSNPTYYRSTDVVGTITNNGLTQTIFLIKDE